ncbi:creatininase family protein [Maribellus sp. YY47]|uniref:creatininase family protein n=1 Tax=Maribellus sp. YY47 TaxID=2929486 RepID=UPI002001A253|nr:creatininase family protein [Maribellus sp. YY47]MCK3684000.1 creatininase family protein [Maribellus sp. YY47]
MKPFILEQTNWKQIKNTQYDIAILPWGATEPHNYHLPYGTDSLETSKVSQESAAKAWANGTKVMVLPVIPLGSQNPGQIDMPFCLHTPPSTQLMILKDIVRALNRQGIKKLVIINGHGGNDFKPMIRELLPQFPEMFLSLVEWFKITTSVNYFEEAGDHADEMETSVVMHYYPELVLPLDEAGEGTAKKHKLKAFREKTAWSPRPWDKVTEDTGIGNPKKATAEKGKRFVEEVTNKIAAYLTELALCDVNDLYE